MKIVNLRTIEDQLYHCFRLAKVNSVSITPEIHVLGRTYQKMADVRLNTNYYASSRISKYNSGEDVL